MDVKGLGVGEVLIAPRSYTELRKANQHTFRETARIAQRFNAKSILENANEVCDANC